MYKYNSEFAEYFFFFTFKLASSLFIIEIMTSRWEVNYGERPKDRAEFSRHNCGS